MSSSARLLRSIIATLVCAAVLVPAAPIVAQQDESSGDLVSRAARDGQVNVIVTLRTSEADARGVPGPAAVDRVQSDFISRYSGDMKSGTVIERISGLPIVYLETTSEVLQRMQQDGEVIGIEENGVRYPTLARSAPMIQADKSWSVGATGKGTAIAVLDTGVDARHPFFGGRVIEEACFSAQLDGSKSLCPNGLSQQVGRGSATPCSGIPGCDHGTHVAGIAAGKLGIKSGIAPEASVIAIQVFSDCRSLSPTCTLSARDSDILNGLAHVLKLASRYKIASVNLSLGGKSYSKPCDKDGRSYLEAFKALRHAGVAVVVASGNDSSSENLNAPACISNAISVGSIDKSGSISSFSNSADMLSVLAPGGDIESSLLGGTFGTMSGTSMATPHIAGAIAAIRSLHPKATVDEILVALQKTGSNVRDARNGLRKPLVQIKQAEKALNNPAEPPPLPPPTLLPGDRALIIGIDQYQNSKLNLPLDSSVRDAENIRNLLVSAFNFRPEQIKTLTNEQATREGILSNMRSWLQDGTRAGDRAIFYYSGHGAQVKDRNGDEEDGLDETLVPYDAGPSGKQHIIDDEIGAIFDAMSSRKVTAIFDSCFSGTVTRSLGLEMADGYQLMVKTPPEADLEDVASEPSASSIRGSGLFEKRSNEDAFLKRAENRIVWTAASNTQYALVERVVPASGLFTNRFVAGLKDKKADSNRNGLISFSELQAYVRAESAEYCRKKDCNLGLTPTLEAPAEMLGRDIVSGKKDDDPSGEIGDTIGPGPAPSELELTLLPGTDVKVGQSFRYRVRSPKPGYLILLDLDAGGKLHQIYPNKYTRSRDGNVAIAANATVMVPDVADRFRMVADEPTGEGTLIAIVTEDPVNFSDLTTRNLSFDEVEDEAFAGRLAERLFKVWRERMSERGARYSVTYVPYRIVR